MEQGLKPGTTLRNGDYRIVRTLGQGGFGITYLAIDVALDRQVAIKEFFPKNYCDREGNTSHVTLGSQSTVEFINKLKTKFIKEARNIAKFDNPGIIKIHAAFEENNTAYYVMDFIEGESLSSKIKRDGPMSVPEALRCVNKVGEALEYVHSHRINHLDVKPANIMVRRADNRPILIDFGMSKQYDSEGNQTSTTPTGISHGYAPMEQYNDGGVKEFSPQTDLYSLAATLYYLLSGIVPPQATKLVEDELTFPSTIPTNLVPAISKAMSSGRRDRQKTVELFLKDINEDPETEIKPEPKPQPKPKQEPKSQPKPEPKPQPKATPKPKPKPESVTPPSGNDSDGKKKWYVIGWVAVVVAIIMVVIFLPKGSGSTEPDVIDSVAVVAEQFSPGAVRKVSGMYYNSSLGACSYTGEVDSLDNPHGKGRAEWESGIGKYYDGEWVHGEMDGDCTYLNRENYKFEGKFKAGHYSEGKLTNPDGSYYVGTFDKNGNKWNGTEFDKNGNRGESWKDGI